MISNLDRYILFYNNIKDILLMIIYSFFNWIQKIINIYNDFDTVLINKRNYW